MGCVVHIAFPSMMRELLASVTPTLAGENLETNIFYIDDIVQGRVHLPISFHLKALKLKVVKDQGQETITNLHSTYSSNSIFKFKKLWPKLFIF